MSNLPNTLPPGATASQMKEDAVDANTTYYGWADRGVATSATAWLLMKVSVSGNVTSVQWASDSFDKAWDNRASESYS